VALRGTNTEMAAKPRRAAPVSTAFAPVVLHPKPREAAPPKKLDAVAKNSAATAPPVQQARDDQQTPAPAPELRTAYSAPPPNNSDQLAGAQPVVPANSFESRWAAIR